MKIKKIYLVRHGQTDYNLKGIVQGGKVNTSLNETGKKQAEAFFKAYQDVPFLKVYTSTLNRSIETVQSFIDKGVPHEAHYGFNEISWGDKDGKIVTSEDNKEYWNILNEWDKGNVDAKFNGAESPREVQMRQKEAMDLILSRPDEELILICMHGRAMRILLSWILNYDLSSMRKFEHYNLGLYLLNYTGSMFSIEKFNDIEHLKSLEINL